MTNKPLLTDYDKNPFPNPSPTTFHGIWTEWPEIHDQKLIKKNSVYVLRHKSPFPEGGKPFFVEKTHPSDLGSVSMTDDFSKARRFVGTYLLRTMWGWELDYAAVPA